MRAISLFPAKNGRKSASFAESKKNRKKSKKEIEISQKVCYNKVRNTNCVKGREHHEKKEIAIHFGHRCRSSPADRCPDHADAECFYSRSMIRRRFLATMFI